MVDNISTILGAAMKTEKDLQALMNSIIENIQIKDKKEIRRVGFIPQTHLREQYDPLNWLFCGARWSGIRGCCTKFLQLLG